MNLDDLVNNPNPGVAGAALAVKNAQAELASGTISQVEYNDMVASALSDQKVTEACAGLDNNSDILEAFKILSTIASLAASA